MARSSLESERSDDARREHAAGTVPEAPRTHRSPAGDRIWTVGCVALCLHAAFVAWRLQPGILVDDAAITFRYAERLAAGLGVTYNDHERVLRASNRLYVLLLSIGPRVGLDVELLARILGGVLFTACALIGALVVARISTRPFGIAAGILLASQPFFRDQMLSGMETGLAVTLGLLVILSLLDQRHYRAAAFMGLALWTNLHAAMLSLGPSAACFLLPN